MAAHPEIETLIGQVARRYDRLLACKVIFIAIAIAAGVAVLASLAWVLRGHAVPAWVPLTITGAVLLGAAVFWWVKRMPPEAAVRETDRFFDLKDAVASARHLSITRPEDAVTSLQWEWLKPRLVECDVNAIVAPFPKRTAVVSVLLAVAAIWLGLMPPSPAVREAEKIARETRERVIESKDQLEKLIEELEKDITAPEEKEALKMDEFRKMVKSIDETGNRAEAARQFARIEQKIRNASRALDQRRDEETLHMAAGELAKAAETEARQLGKKLDAKELKEAAEMLEKLAGKKLDAKDLKEAKTPAEKKEKLDEAKQELAKMRAVSKRLAAAGKQRQGARQAQQGKQGGAEGQGEGEAGEGEGETAQGEAKDSKPLEDLMAELDDAAAEAEKDLEEMENNPEGEEPEEGDGEAMAKANGALGKIGKHMKGMNGKRMAKSKLDQLREAMAKAGANSQGQGQSQMLGLAQGTGGREAGKGTDSTRRKETDDLQKNGQLTQLQGQHGQGPSLSSVEDADSGTAVSGRRGDAKQRDFARQAESFVQRDDVPESLKLGVRNYFENLQSAQQAAEPTPPKENK